MRGSSFCQPVIKQFQEYRLLTGKMVVKCPLTNLSKGANIRHTGAIVTLMCKAINGSLQDVFASFFSAELQRFPSEFWIPTSRYYYYTIKKIKPQVAALSRQGL
jgi:hypothetical protein